MTSKITALSEIFVTIIAFEWTVACVLPEVISQVTGLLKHAFAARVIAFEEQVVSIGLRILNLYHLMPIFGSIFEGLPFSLV